MAKLTRVPAKVFAASAAADEIGQFGSAVAGVKLETSDVATIQALSAWLDGWSEALVSGNRYPALQEMNGLLKVLSYQGAYALQEGIAEYDSATTYYIGSIVKKTGTFELYGSLTDDNIGNALTVDTEWKFLVDLDTLSNALIYTASTANMPTISNNTTDANNDIDFSAGFCYDLTTLKKITNLAITKQLDAVFAEGTNQGGLDTGTKAINTWYHCFAISKTDGTSDFLFSLSATAPTMPSGYVNKRRIGSIRVDSDGNITGFVQTGSKFLWKSQIRSLNTNGTIAKTALILSTPTTLKTEAIISFSIDAQAAGASLLILFDKNLTTNKRIVGTNNGFGVNSFCSIFTNTSSQIDYQTEGAPTSVIVDLLGYIDERMN